MKSLISGFFWLCSLSIVVVNNTNAQDISEKADGWYKIRPEARITAPAFLSDYLGFLGLNTNSDVYELRNQQNDQLGMVHYRYQQLHRGIPVEGGEMLLHEKNGYLQTANGEVVTGISGSPQPLITPTEALQWAEQHIGATHYLHHDEEQLRYFQGVLDHPEDLLPSPELVWAHPDYNNRGEEYRLAYKLDIYALEPMSRQYVFVDAQNGELLFTLDRICNGNTVGTAETRYHGTRPIYTDSVSAEVYRLRETITGGGIETYDLNTTTQYSQAVDFIDSNNYWNNYNAEQDEVATDAHWGAQVTYEYFYNEHGRDSYDDQGAKLISYVHYGQNYVNAFWNGQFMTYGDGNGSFGPLTALDVVAHEISHGVTGNSARLIYRGESGALNESFSDIFGAAVEFLNDSADGDWIIGEEMNASGLRNMKNPKPYGDPNTYQGQNWGYGLFIDNGYVHSNSGVQNFWFYLLSDGDAGVNDHGDQYVVKGIGVQKAGAIAYRNLNNYLTRSSDHFDARQGALQAAADLYGSCSEELIQTANAWYAVGLGEAMGEMDLSLAEILVDDFLCAADSAEPIGVRIKNLSCSQSIPAGDSIFLSFASNGGIAYTDTLVLVNALPPGSDLIYNFTAGVDLSQAGNNFITAYINYPADSAAYNDTIAQFAVENRQLQNSDFGLLEVVSPVSGCELSDSTDLELRLFFNGCDSVEAGTVINLAYSLNNGPQQQLSYTLPARFYGRDTFLINIPSALDLSAGGRMRLDFELNNSSDLNSSNDKLRNYRLTNPVSISDELISFEHFWVLDSLAIITAEEANVDRSYLAGNTGFFGLMMTGGAAVEYPEGIELPTAASVWNVNPAFFSQACACVDARDMIGVTLNFDLRQRYSEIYQHVLHRNLPYASAFRITVDGQQQGLTRVASSANGDIFQTLSYSLNDFAGSEFELCFEAKTLMNRSVNGITQDGDEVHIDNVFLNGHYVGLDEFSLNTNAITVFPNPSHGSFFLSHQLKTTEEFSATLSDLSGKELRNLKEKLQPGQALEIRSDLPAGTYLLQWVAGQHSGSEKVIIY